MRGKLVYLQKQYLRYIGGLITLTIHVTILHTDASLTGWGITDGISPSRGLWHKAELDHINVLELKPIEIGIYTYCKNKNFLLVRVLCDNVAAIACINKMGGIKSETCNNIACIIWNFCIENKLWLSGVHIPGKCNRGRTAI